MKTGSMERYREEPPTMEVDDVWKYEAVREYGPGPVRTDE
jgi:hypothetical protein